MIVVTTVYFWFSLQFRGVYGELLRNICIEFILFVALVGLVLVWFDGGWLRLG